MTLLPQCLSRRILTTPLSSTPPLHYNTTSRTATRRTMIPISICSRFHHTPPAHHLLIFNSSAKPTSEYSPFSLCISGCCSISHATAAPPVNHGYDEEKETSDSSKLRILKQKVEGLEINCDSYEPGRYEVLVCPKCKGGQSLDRVYHFIYLKMEILQRGSVPLLNAAGQARSLQRILHHVVESKSIALD